MSTEQAGKENRHKVHWLHTAPPNRKQPVKMRLRKQQQQQQRQQQQQ